jgi:hypothetical protein
VGSNAAAAGAALGALTLSITFAFALRSWRRVIQLREIVSEWIYRWDVNTPPDNLVNAGPIIRFDVENREVPIENLKVRGRTVLDDNDVAAARPTVAKHRPDGDVPCELIPWIFVMHAAHEKGVRDVGGVGVPDVRLGAERASDGVDGEVVACRGVVVESEFVGGAVKLDDGSIILGSGVNGDGEGGARVIEVDYTFLRVRWSVGRMEKGCEVRTESMLEVSKQSRRRQGDGINLIDTRLHCGGCD